jgi:hypothetical protein
MKKFNPETCPGDDLQTALDNANFNLSELMDEKRVIDDKIRDQERIIKIVKRRGEELNIKLY